MSQERSLLCEIAEAEEEAMQLSVMRCVCVGVCLNVCMFVCKCPLCMQGGFFV